LQYLIDTHVALWFVTGDPRLSKTVADAISRASAEPFVSYASFWELSIKKALGRHTVDLTALREELTKQKMELLPISIEHAIEVGDLEPHHRDPFDRMIIIQAKIEAMTVVTHDRAFEAYGIPTIWT
jgi:PIN domain nuclease of toxin-antitoxin system